MKQAQRFELIDRVARELQSRFKTYELDRYLNSMGVPTPGSAGGVSSKWVYAKGILAGESARKIVEIADDLGLDTDVIATSNLQPPRVWVQNKQFRLFISHVSTSKHKAIRLRDCLAMHAILGFVAHEDIEPTKPWEQELRRALHTMDALISIHSAGFSASNWCQQEVGFAVGSGKKIIPLGMGEVPTGFISKDQALLRKNRNAEEIASEIAKLLSQDDRTSARLLEAQMDIGALDKPFDGKIPF